MVVAANAGSCIVTEDNQVIGEGLSGPANPLRGMKVATDSILAATQQALTCAGLAFNSHMSKLIVGAGLAGVNMPQYYPYFLRMAASVCSNYI